MGYSSSFVSAGVGQTWATSTWRNSWYLWGDAAPKRSMLKLFLLLHVTSHVWIFVSGIVDKMMIAKDGSSDLRDSEVLQFEIQGKSEDLLVVCQAKVPLVTLTQHATSAESHMCYPATSCTPNRIFARSKLWQMSHWATQFRILSMSFLLPRSSASQPAVAHSLVDQRNNINHETGSLPRNLLGDLLCLTSVQRLQSDCLDNRQEDKAFPLCILLPNTYIRGTIVVWAFTHHGVLCACRKHIISDL